MGSKLQYNRKKKSFVSPDFLHIELTEKCPLKCPQCYCTLEGKDMEHDLLKQMLYEAKELGVKNILLTGGEPLLYPYLKECVYLINQLGMQGIISSSGVGLTKELINDLYSSGLFRMYISLNGSYESIHNLSRDCYCEAIKAINCIKNSGNWCGVNWVARKDNYKDFPVFLELMQSLNVDCIDILASKYSAVGDICDLDDIEIEELSSYITDDMKSYINIELCYPKLRNKVFGDTFHGIFNTCLSGRLFFDIHTDGSFSPCRHTQIRHNCKNVYDYWNNFQELQSYRNVEKCVSCQKVVDNL